MSYVSQQEHAITCFRQQIFIRNKTLKKWEKNEKKPSNPVRYSQKDYKLNKKNKKDKNLYEIQSYIKAHAKDIVDGVDSIFGEDQRLISELKRIMGIDTHVACFETIEALYEELDKVDTHIDSLRSKVRNKINKKSFIDEKQYLLFILIACVLAIHLFIILTLSFPAFNTIVMVVTIYAFLFLSSKFCISIYIKEIEVEINEIKNILKNKEDEAAELIDEIFYVLQKMPNKILNKIEEKFLKSKNKILEEKHKDFIDRQISNRKNISEKKYVRGYYNIEYSVFKEHMLACFFSKERAKNLNCEYFYFMIKLIKDCNNRLRNKGCEQYKKKNKEHKITLDDFTIQKKQYNEFIKTQRKYKSNTNISFKEFCKRPKIYETYKSFKSFPDDVLEPFTETDSRYERAGYSFKEINVFEKNNLYTTLETFGDVRVPYSKPQNPQKKEQSQSRDYIRLENINNLPLIEEYT